MKDLLKSEFRLRWNFLKRKQIKKLKMKSKIFPSMRILAVVERNHIKFFIFVMKTFVVELYELKVV